jgi:TonB family protein
MGNPIEVQRLSPDPQPIAVELLSLDLQTPPADASSPSATDLPAKLVAPLLPMDAIPAPQSESPRIDPDVQLHTAAFASRAQLRPGEVATVILLLQIGADGTVLSAEVVRGNGSEAASEAALDYARATRWIPGTVDGEPRAMQASLTVILGERG